MSDSQTPRLSRRQFVSNMAATAASIQFLTHPVFGQDAPSNKLNLAGIGLRSQGLRDLQNCGDENVVALCDVDLNCALAAREEWPEARFYVDYRELFAAEKDLDGVVIGTPDHTHAVITMEALRRGLHVYCEKPLTHSVYEARTVTEAARKAGVMTQMGNQGRSSEHIRTLKEWVEAGAIGNVTEVHAWTDRPVGGDPWSDFPQLARPEEMPPVPEGLDWDKWIGPAQLRPYHPAYHPETWRAWLDFGTGALGDMGCHILDPAYYVLELGAPTMVEASTTHYIPEVSSETYPRASLVRYHFPARNGRPPVTLNWYDGRLLPFRPKGVPNDQHLMPSGALFVGDEGVIHHGSHGARAMALVPEEKHRAFLPNRPPKTIPRVKGNHQSDWIRAIRDGEPACSNFEYGGGLTEMVLLGVAAIRTPNQRLEWDAESMAFTNSEEATALVNPPYREGWSL